MPGSGYSGDLPPARFNLSRYCLEHGARDFPDKTALVVATDAADAGLDTVWTYGDLEDTVLRLAESLRSLGVPDGARLLIRMGNSADYALVFLAAIAAGLVPIPASSDLSASEVEFILEDSGARVIAHSDELDLPPSANVSIVLTGEDIAEFKEGARAGLRRHRGGRPRLYGLHIGHVGPAQRRASRASGDLGPPPDVCGLVRPPVFRGHHTAHGRLQLELHHGHRIVRSVGQWCNGRFSTRVPRTSMSGRR